MNTLSLCWFFLTIKGLPEEIIVKIMFQYSGLQHPLVKIILNATKMKKYEELQKIPFSKSIYKFYLSPKYYSNLFGINIIDFINEKQTNYFNDVSSYTHYSDPGYFIPRQFGRLFYNVNNDDDFVDTTNLIGIPKKIYSSSSVYYNVYTTPIKLNTTKTNIILHTNCIMDTLNTRT